MTTRNALIVSGLMILSGIAYSLYLYPSLPPLLPIHWDINGRVDGWAPRSWAAFFGPAFGALMVLVLLALPMLSPRQFQVDSFRRVYDYIIVWVVGLMTFVHLVTLHAALNAGIDSGRWIVGGLMLLMAVLGNVLGKVRRNFWVGIRTPWTLASDEVWVATHRLAARLLVPAGVLGALLAAIGVPVAICFWLLMASILWPVVYSLILYRRTQRG